MGRSACLALATLTLGACAGTPGPLVEAGYPTGSLGLAAIQREDWPTAERLLTQARKGQREDPARLINLGRVYLETGRREEALAIWRRALAAGNHDEVELLSGATARTDDIARAALAYYGQPVETAGR